MNNHKVIECRGVKKHFGEGNSRVDALRGVDFELYSGKLLMVVGPSGSGKTTLISIIAGILNQNGGECRVFGKELSTMEEEAKAHFRGENIGFVFQAFNLIPMLTATENVTIPLLLAGVEEKEAMMRAEELLNRFGLGDKLKAYPGDLSGGQQQRVAIARSCIHSPGLIVCDEPTSALDHETGAHVMELFRTEVLEKDRALVIVTHDARIFPYADRIINLDDGVIREG
ncbi:MAG: Macrolide export ATP-binding/permease protein MacB [Chlamydiae bacterium]|nr:Macrolide export ATP-binding/permease protein MacB [Chlamydiota bacterium]